MAYNFNGLKLDKRYGRIKRGWHNGRIHQAGTKNKRKGNGRYIEVIFEIIGESQCNDIVVPAFFPYYESGKADQRFLNMGMAAGLTGDYGNDLNSVLRDLVKRELKIFVVHRYKKDQRFERVIDFRALHQASDGVDQMDPGDDT